MNNGFQHPAVNNSHEEHKTARPAQNVSSSLPISEHTSINPYGEETDPATLSHSHSLHLPEDELLNPADEQPQWELVPGSIPPRMNGPEDESDISGSQSIFTLYFSRQETNNTQGESGAEPVENAGENKPEEYKFRFTRVPGAKPERSRSSPPRPLTELEGFRESSEFLKLEAAALDAINIVQKNDGKFELDSLDGHNRCKSFLDNVEELMISFKANSAGREYRSTFTQAYKALYKEGSLCYLTEVLDSAQEGSPRIE